MVWATTASISIMPSELGGGNSAVSDVPGHLFLGSEGGQIDSDSLQSHDDGQRRRGMRDNFLLYFDASQVHELRGRQSEGFAMGTVGDPALLLRFFPGLFGFLKFDHRNFALLLNNRLRSLFNDPFRRQDTPHDHPIQPDGEILLVDQLGLELTGNRVLQFVAGRRVGA